MSSPSDTAARAAAVLALLGLVAAASGACSSSHPPEKSLPLRIEARMTLPAPSTRFDYADIDPQAHRLFLAQLGASPATAPMNWVIRGSVTLLTNNR